MRSTLPGRRLIVIPLPPLLLSLVVLHGGCGSSSTNNPPPADASRGGPDSGDAPLSSTGGQGAGGAGTGGTNAGSGGALGKPDGDQPSETGAGVQDAALDGVGECPTQVPLSSAACQGAETCRYGRSTCCGQVYPVWTCSCLDGAFACLQTAECNGLCPVVDAAVTGDALDSGNATFDSGSAMLDAAGTGAACGATDDAPCPAGQHCEWPDKRCGAGVHGTCVSFPGGVICAPATAPVCGCDGRNYAGTCEASRAGVDVSTSASCPAPAGSFRCGWSYCQHQVEYCHAQVGGAVSNPGSYVCNPLPSACGGVPSCACIDGLASSCDIDGNGDVTVTLAVP